MSADRRKQILIVFASLAVVLVGVIAYVSPNFRNEDVSGSIGAVQKHRAPQIQAQDVVLGDESVKKEAQILYAGFLHDAAALRNLGSEAETNAKLSESLAARKSDLNRRFMEGMSESLAEAKKMANEDPAMLADAEALARAVRDQEQLASADAEQLSARLSSMLASYHWGARSLEAGKADIIDSIGSEEQLASMIRNRDEDGAKATLAKAVDSLEARAAAMRLRSQAEYLAAIARQAKVVANAEAALASEEQLAARKGIIAILIGEADQLEARAVRNMEEQFASDTALAARLNRMISLAGELGPTCPGCLESRKQLQAAEQELQARVAMREQLARSSKLEAIQASALQQRATQSRSR